MPVSLNSLLSVARSSLAANQAAMQVVGDNIANAGTPGYTRKRAELAPGPSQVLPEGVFGTGVAVSDVTQSRDRFLDAAHRSAVSTEQQHQVRHDFLSQIESALGEPGAGGLASTLDAFWNSWADLANDSLSGGARAVVRERGQQLVAQVSRLVSAAATQRASAYARLDAEVAQVNALTEQIAMINERIVAAEAGGVTAGALRDERDLAIDALARMASVQVIERGSGAVAVAVDSLTLVDGGQYQSLRAPAIVGTEVRLATTSGTRLVPEGGSLQAYLAVLNDDLPEFNAALDTIASTLTAEVNAIHRAGVNAAGDSVAFFDPGPLGDDVVTASSFHLSDAVRASPNAIAAGRGVLNPDTLVFEYRSGRNDVAGELARLRTEGSVTSLYGTLISDLAIDTAAAADTGRTYAALAGQAANRRDSIMGVSTDEELVDLMRLQSAYGAAARVVSAADEMLRTLLDMKR